MEKRTIGHSAGRTAGRGMRVGRAHMLAKISMVGRCTAPYWEGIAGGLLLLDKGAGARRRMPRSGDRELSGPPARDDDPEFCIQPLPTPKGVPGAAWRRNAGKMDYPIRRGCGKEEIQGRNPPDFGGGSGWGFFACFLLHRGTGEKRRTTPAIPEGPGREEKQKEKTPLNENRKFTGRDYQGHGPTSSFRRATRSSCKARWTRYGEGRARDLRWSS